MYAGALEEFEKVNLLAGVLYEHELVETLRDLEAGKSYEHHGGHYRHPEFGTYGQAAVTGEDDEKETVQHLVEVPSELRLLMLLAVDSVKFIGEFEIEESGDKGQPHPRREGLHEVPYPRIGVFGAPIEKLFHDLQLYPYSS